MNWEQTFAEPGCCIAIAEVTLLDAATGREVRQAAVGDSLALEAVIVAPEEEAISAAIKIRRDRSTRWSEVPMRRRGGDTWRGELPAMEAGRYFYVIEAWTDRFKGWLKSLNREIDAGRTISKALLRDGAQLIESVVGRAGALDAERLQEFAEEFRTGISATGISLKHLAQDESLGRLMSQLTGCRPENGFATTYVKELHLAAHSTRA